ncbi:carbohydrate ABC transporter permease [Cryptosporangium sp. NPDC048952]|uniref:carbohydrate ABC transporter permease n=1 Tax=Cryptosporangium sp. NPDC048952 TaxID=3363961 RepID=UPI003719AFEB
MLPYALILPAVLALTGLLGYPVIRLLVLSTQSFGPRALFTGEAPFVGADNFTAVLADGTFWDVLVRTLIVAGACVALLMGFGVFLAHVLLRASGWARLVTTVVLILVWAMPMVSAALVWQWLFQPRYGVVNWMIGAVMDDAGFRTRDLFAHPLSALSLIILLIVWKGLPFVVLTVLAALGQIPESLVEAAGLDGAGAGGTFRHITLPILQPVLALLTVLEVIWTVNSFTPFWVLTQGGPQGATTTLGVYSYIEAFTRNDYGGGPPSPF